MGALALLFVSVVLVAGLYVITAYNGLVRLRNHCEEAWSNIDTELKRRYNLIPNLVETVKGYAKHEKELLEEVTQLRKVCLFDQRSPAHQAESENELIHALRPLLARVEAYPDLKANKKYLELHHELVKTEDRIQAARRFYNGNVRDNNNRVQTFPSNIVANLFAFKEQEFFEIDDLIQGEPPYVKMQ